MVSDLVVGILVHIFCSGYYKKYYEEKYLIFSYLYVVFKSLNLLKNPK